MHIIAAKAVAMKEADTDAFRQYQRDIVDNARALARELEVRGYRIVSGGTDNHLLLVDVAARGLTGKDSAEALDRARITVNKNAIPFDEKSPFVASGIRLGTPAGTTRGMKTPEMKIIAQLIDEVLSHIGDEGAVKRVSKKVDDLVRQFPLYRELQEEMVTR